MKPSEEKDEDGDNRDDNAEVFLSGGGGVEIFAANKIAVPNLGNMRLHKGETRKRNRQ